MESQEDANNAPNKGTDKVKINKRDQTNEERPDGVPAVVATTDPKLQQKKQPLNVDDIPSFSGVTKPNVSGGGTNNQRSDVTATKTTKTEQTNKETSSLETEASSTLQVKLMEMRLHLFEQEQKQKQLQQQNDKNLLNKQQQEELLLLNKFIDATKKELEKTEENKFPKKRERKKATREIDSFTSNDVSLSSQIRQLEIHSSIAGRKKVKTTKELYAEMQNRKKANMPTTPNISTELSAPATDSVNSLNATPPWPAISCPEISIHSSRALDATSNSIGIIPESSHSDSEIRDSSNIITNSTLVSAESGSENIAQQHAAILRAIIEGLPEADGCHERSLCSCSVVIQDNRPKAVEKQRDFNINDKWFRRTGRHVKPHLDHRILKQQYERKRNAKPTTSAPEEPKIIDNSANAKAATEPSATATITPEKETVTKPQKSIFDYDFDEDDDPLVELRLKVEKEAKEAREKAVLEKHTENPNNSNTKNVEVHFKCDKTQTTPPQQIPQPVMHVDKKIINKPNRYKYIIKEDVNCLAKKQLISKEQITEFHINALHNYYIPNVNGNWSDVKEYQNEYNKSDDEGINIVPKYSPLMKNRFRKCIPEEELQKNYQPNKEMLSKRMEKSYKLPFLGIANRLVHYKKTEQKSQNEEIHENVINNENNRDVVENIPLTETVKIDNKRMKVVINGIERQIPMDNMGGSRKRLARHRDGQVKRKQKMHKKLFHSHELYPIGHNKEMYGHYHEKLFDNISSCSSDCDTCSASSDEDLKFNTSDLPKLKNKIKMAVQKLSGITYKNPRLNVNYHNNNDDDNNNNTASNTATYACDESDHDVIIDLDSEISNESLIVPNDNQINQLPEHNNGFLKSFNKIFTEFKDISELDLIDKNITLTEAKSVRKETSTTTSTTTTTTTATGDK